MHPDWSLESKVAVVTGASRGGIGEAYAQTLAGAGAAVVCADIHLDGARVVADAVATDGGKAFAVRVDIADEDSVDAMVGETIQQFGGVDILVNNAALMTQIVAKPAVEHTRQDWARAFAVNRTGAW